MSSPNNPKTTAQLSLLGSLAQHFDKSDFPYWVMGGFALDGVLGKITRPHDDIDFLIDYSDRDRVAEVVTTKSVYDFLVIIDWGKYKFVAYDPVRQLRVDFAYFHRKNGQIVFSLEGWDFPFPGAVLPQGLSVRVDQTSFNIVDPTLIYATKIQASAREKDEEASALESHLDRQLLDQILPTARDLSQHHFLIH